MTLRWRLTLVSTALAALVLAAAAAALLTAQTVTLRRGVDEQLRQRADNVAPALAGAAAGGLLATDGDREDGFAQVLDAAGRVVAGSANVRGLPAVVGVPRGPERLQTVGVPALSRYPYRVLSRPVPGRADGWTLVLGRNTDDVADSIGTLRASLLVSVPASIALLGLLCWWLTGRALQPVEAINDEVGRIGADQLHRRVPVPAAGSEMARLATTMNQMLARVERAVDRQRRFVADASHELRTPLARVHSSLDLALLEEPDGQRAAVGEALAGLGDLEAVLADLLLLATPDDGSGPPSLPVALDAVALEEAQRLREEQHLPVDTSGVRPARVSGHRRQLGRLVANLLQNAARHAGGQVRVAVREDRDAVVLVVGDDGPGIPPPAREEVFERFVRLDGSRSRSTGGTGLGLAIVRDIAERHGGSARVVGPAGAGTTVEVRLPRCSGPPGSR